MIETHKYANLCYKRTKLESQLEELKRTLTKTNKEVRKEAFNILHDYDVLSCHNAEIITMENTKTVSFGMKIDKQLYEEWKELIDEVGLGYSKYCKVIAGRDMNVLLSKVFKTKEKAIEFCEIFDIYYDITNYSEEG